jgi:hypothetical protein
MNGKNKFQPNWDDASYMMRTDPERIPKRRPPSEPVQLPEYEGFNRWRLIAAWKAVGLGIDPELVLGHALVLDFWLHEREPR